MKIHVSYAICKIYQRETDSVADVELPYTNERELKRELKKKGIHLISFEVAKAELDLTIDQYADVIGLAERYYGQNMKEEKNNG